MKTKYLYFFITIIFSLFLISCNEEEIDIPVTYKYYNVSFFDKGEIKEIKVKENDRINKDNVPIISSSDDEVCIGWYKDDELFDFDEIINEDFLLKTKYKYLVTFIDESGSLLSTQYVIEGNDAVLPDLCIKDDKKFYGYSDDYKNINESKVIKVIYSDLDGYFKINYHYDGLNLEYNSKEEMLFCFLNDFYDFLNPDENKVLFFYGYGEMSAIWPNYFGGSFSKINKLIKNNDIELDDDNYFLNSSKYKDKWYPLASYVRDKICKNNKRFGYSDVDYYHGALDFYRYLIDDPNVYIDTYGGSDVFYGLPIFKSNVNKYKEKDKVNLVPLCDYNFDGWYLDEDFKIGPINSIDDLIGNIDLYAKIKNNEPLLILDYGYDERKEVLKIDNVNLPILEREGYEFKGWYMNYIKVEDDFDFNYDVDIRLDAKWNEVGSMNYNYLIYDDKIITYADVSYAVEIPDTYIESDGLRGVWVSSFIKSYQPSNDEVLMKEELNRVLDLLDYYNFNCVFFHLRTHNNAFYQTKLAPIKQEYGTYDDFNNFNYLPWFIEECHKRGIEFHAWLNPYRISLSGLPLNTTVDDVSNKFKDYPLNPASNSDNILLTVASDNGSLGAILNPAKQEVIDYLNDVIIELLENYDIDGIHFDDYFYHRLLNDSRDVTIRDLLSELDQIDYVNWINNHSDSQFSIDSSTDKEDWKRMNVNRLIESLHYTITNFNITHNRNVLFGISPTGIYKSGDGSVESGSLTKAGGHFGAYTYNDSLEWMKQGWIDYILPQCYTSFNNPNYKFQEIVSWWNKVGKEYNCKVYIGLSITKSIDNTYEYSWRTEEDELINQLLFIQSMDYIDGICMFSFTALTRIHNENVISHKAFERLKNELWVNKVVMR